jgi:hypothetical protein
VSPSDAPSGAAGPPATPDAQELLRRNRQLQAQLESARARLSADAAELERTRQQLARTRARKVLRAVDAVGAARRDRRRLKALPRTLLEVARDPGSGGDGRTAAGKPTARPADVGPPRALDATPARSVGRLGDLKVAAVLDTFSAGCFGSEASVDLELAPGGWRERVTDQRPDLLLVESAWQGNDGRWQYQVGSYAYPETVGLPALVALLRWCREHDVPTVFWNKEDPVHFDKFREAAGLFDVILTTDADRIEPYQQLPGSRAGRVGALPFAAQPRLHHPFDEPWPREDAPVFAGTYYRNRHADRKAQLEMLLDAARDDGLIVFDRMAGRRDDSVGFPERFLPHVQGGLAYDEMVDAYRRYTVFLNTNSVTTSPTMFSRRVFELLASGTPVVSTPSVGMEAMFGDVVRSVRTEDEARAALSELRDPDTWQATRVAGLRRVLSSHTYAHRLAEVAGMVGLAVDPYPDEAVTVLLAGAPRSDIGPLVDALGGVPVLATDDAGVEHPRAHAIDAGGTTVDRVRRLAAAASTPWVLVVTDPAAAVAGVEDLTLARRAAPDAEVVGLGGPAATTSVPPPGALLVRRQVAAAHGVDPDDPAGSLPGDVATVTFPTAVT